MRERDTAQLTFSHQTSAPPQFVRATLHPVASAKDIVATDEPWGKTVPFVYPSSEPAAGRFRPRLPPQWLDSARRLLLSRPLCSLFSGISHLIREDPWLLRPVAAFVIVQLAMIGWDLPTAYGWENDGAAPRDFFGGIADNLTWGKTHRYPLMQYLLIGLACLPVFVVALVFGLVSGEALSIVVLGVPTMTALAVVAKSLHLFMAVISLLLLGRIARSLFSRNVARWVLCFAVANVSIAYYGRTTNVDTAYMMWILLALERLIAVRNSPSRRNHLQLAFAIAAAVATKDQSYAAFLLVVPLHLLDKPPTVALWQRHARNLVTLFVWTVLFYGLLSGAAFNPLGFVRRLHELAGTNSQDWRNYEMTWPGFVANVGALVRLQTVAFWPVLTVAGAWIGVLMAPFVRGELAKPRAHGSPLWRWMPLLSGFGSTVAFALVVGRAEHRFILPMGWWLSLYAGLAVERLVVALRSLLPRPVVVGALFATLLLPSGWLHLRLAVTQWFDPRRDIERFLATSRPFTQVETYGLGVYLPRFDYSHSAPYRVTRVSGLDSPRAPAIVGLRELACDYRDVQRRAPEFLVLPGGFANRFAPKPGHRRTMAMDRYRRELGAMEFFPALLADQLPCYRLMTLGDYAPPAWIRALGLDAYKIHGSTGERVWISKRTRSCTLDRDSLQ